MKNKIINGFLLFISALILTNCEKDEKILPISNSTGSGIISVNNGILVFSNGDSYQKGIKENISLNQEERINWEDTKGMKSFGRICDEVYNEFISRNFQSIEEMKAFVSSNSEFLQLIEDEKGELILETVLFNNPLRYLINKDKIYQIGTKVYKVFEDHTETTDIQNINKLIKNNCNKNDSDIELLNFNSKKDQNFKDAAYNVGTSASSMRQNGNNRTWIYIDLFYNDFYDIYGVPMTEMINRVTIRPYKRTLGIWTNCGRTISYDVKVALDGYTTSGWYRWFYHFSDNNISDNNLVLDLGSGVISIGTWARYDMHYGGYDCWADTPSTDAVPLEKNIELFN